MRALLARWHVWFDANEAELAAWIFAFTLLAWSAVCVIGFALTYRR